MASNQSPLNYGSIRNPTRGNRGRGRFSGFGASRSNNRPEINIIDYTRLSGKGKAPVRSEPQPIVAQQDTPAWQPQFVANPSGEGRVDWFDDPQMEDFPDQQEYDQFDHLEESSGYGQGHKLTLGELIDGYRQLSEPDAAAFRAVVGISQPTNLSYAQMALKPQVVVNPNLGHPAMAGIRPGPAFGTTIDPQSGKVYRIQPPKERSQTLEGLKVNYNRAREALAQYLGDRQYVYDVAAAVTFTADNQRVEGDNHLRELQEGLLRAKGALHQYKIDHPEEYTRPRTTRGPRVPVRNVPNRGQGQQVPAQNEPAADGGRG